jgi:predicted MFS family arabinose efflux permease
MFAVSLALLANAYPDVKARAGALAAYGATIGASFAVGPLVGGALTSGLDWRWIFFVNIPIGLFCIWATLRYVVESRDPGARGLDWAGQFLLMGGLFVLVLALLRGNEDGWTSTFIVALGGGAVVLLGAFLAVERRAAAPMLPLGLFRDRSFTGAQIAAFAISASFFAVFMYTTLYLQQILGLSAIEAGLVYLPGTITMLFVSAGTSSLGTRVSARAMVGGGLALVSIGMMLALLVGVDSSWTITLPSLMIGLIGTGLFNPALTAVALGTVPPAQSGLAAGVNDTFRQAGIAVGVAALGALVPADAALGGGDPQAYVDGLHNAMLAGAALAAIGAVAAWCLISKKFGAAGHGPAEIEELAPLVAEEPVLVAA